MLEGLFCSTVSRSPGQSNSMLPKYFGNCQRIVNTKSAIVQWHQKSIQRKCQESVYGDLFTRLREDPSQSHVSEAANTNRSKRILFISYLFSNAYIVAPSAPKTDQTIY